VSVDLQVATLRDFVDGRDTDQAIARLALDSLAKIARVSSENAEHYKEAIVACLDMFEEVPVAESPAAVDQAVRILNQALDLATEEVPRPPAEILTENLPAEIEVFQERSAEDGIHAVAVPEGWTVEQAWEAVARGEGVPGEGPVRWANVEVKDGKFVRALIPEPEEEDEDE
jgi:hypothetical protein